MKKLCALAAIFLCLTIAFLRAQAPASRTVGETLTDAVPARPAPAKASVGTQSALRANSATPLAKSDVSERVATLVAELPSRRELVGRDAEEFHHAPAALIQAAVKLGKFRERLQAELRSERAEVRSAALAEGRNLYRGCAEREDTLSSLRALCYGNLLEIDADGEAPRVPADIIALAATLRGKS